MNTVSASPSSAELDAIALRADRAARSYPLLDPATRAAALVAAADALLHNADELIALAEAETGLTRARLTGELTRTSVQLRLFADVVRDGSHLDARIDEADPAFVLGPRPELRRVLEPLGPVLNFAASNFPFAFSVAGGDTASALAAGCPVIVKGHSGHPELSRRTAEIVGDALIEAGLPEGVFQLITGQEAGVELLRHPLIAAGSFTGSIHAGRLLADVAAARPAPIPFYGELGSVNPVFVTAAALGERSSTIAAGFVTSVAGSAGQLCTKPGFVFVPDTHDWADAITTAAAAVPEHRMLNPRIAASYAARRTEIVETPGVRIVVDGTVRFDDAEQGWVTPTVVAVSVDSLRRSAHRLLDECFGPLSILVEYAAGAELSPLVEEFFEGNLTATVHAGSGEEGEDVARLVRTLTRHAGRVLFNGWPTGVAVTPAMQHGGPWPATTSGGTSVGTAAISRFLRGVAYQDTPEALLPPALQTANPWGVPQRVSAAGESVTWGGVAEA